MLLLIISFVAGVLTVLAPCILPLLPVIIGGSLVSKEVKKKKVFVIVLSLGLSVIVFTFLLKVSTAFINIPEYVWKLISGGIVFVFGLTLLFPRIWENVFLAKVSQKSNILLGRGEQKNSFLGDVIIGFALGPVFSTCSPTYFIVLATVLPSSLILGVVYLLSYVFGLCLSLFLIAFVGQKVLDRLGILSDSNGTFKKILGILFVLVGVAIIFGFDKKIESKIVGAGFFDVTKIEQKLLEHKDKIDLENESQNTSMIQEDVDGVNSSREMEEDVV